MKHLILIVLVLTACGKGDSGNDSTPSEQKKNVPYTSYYVDKAESLMPCTDDNRGVLAYVRSLDQFQACLESGWSVVNVKGKDGSNGKDGTNGTNGKDGTPTSSNQWFDPVSKKAWVFSGLLMDTASFVDNTCTGDYRLPTAAEIMSALGHGMKAASQLVVSPMPTQIFANTGVPYLLSNGLQGVAGLTAQFCIAK